METFAAKPERKTAAWPAELPPRTSRQVVSGDARGEAEVVLDTGTRAGLSAERPGVEDDHGEPLGGRIDRRGEPRRTGTDDGDVVGSVRMIRRHHAEAARQ